MALADENNLALILQYTPDPHLPDSMLIFTTPSHYSIMSLQTADF